MWTLLWIVFFSSATFSFSQLAPFVKPFLIWKFIICNLWSSLRLSPSIERYSICLFQNATAFFFFDNVKKARSFTHCYILNKPRVWLIQKTTYALSSKSDAWSGCPCSSRGWTRRGTEVPSNPSTSVICDSFAAMWTSSRSTYMPDYSPHFAKV